MAAALGLVFALDRVSGLAPVQHLYYIPIILASVRFGYRGSATAAVAILLYHLANPRVITFQYTEGDVLQIALFVGIGVAAAKLANDRRRLHRLAITDDLTGLHNLRSFEAQLRALLRRAVIYQLPVALLVLDLDRLKSLNDTHGHLAGAEEVRAILAVHAGCFHQAQVRFVHECGGLQAVARPLAGHTGLGDPVQLGMDDRDQLVERRVVALAPGRRGVW